MLDTIQIVWAQLIEHVMLTFEGNPFTNPAHFYSPRYLLIYLAIGALLIIVRGDSDGSVRGIFKSLLPRSIYRHSSSAMDVKVLLCSLLITRSGSLYFVLVGGLLTAGAIESLWIAALGEPTAKITVTLLYGSLYGLGIYLVNDISTYWWHYFAHKVGWMWELHKTHHSAEVLHPLTNSRFHPADIIINRIFNIVGLAIVQGSFMHFFEGPIVAWTVASISVIFFVEFALVNFWHSHIWVSYGRILNHIIISPSMHQIHHSALPQHRDRNLSEGLAIWDWMFGTIYVPEGRETFPVGLGEGEENPHTTLAKFYIDPLVNSARKMTETIRGLSWNRSDVST